MSIRLKIASFWLPNFILKRELDNVARKTIEGLNDLLKKHLPEKLEIIDEKDEVLKGSRRKISNFSGFVKSKILQNLRKPTVFGVTKNLWFFDNRQKFSIFGLTNYKFVSLEERRSIMTRAHNKRVEILIQELGYEKAVKIGRNAMFKVGYDLGQEVRRKLGAQNNFKDLELAAKILYKILGIEFEIKNEDGNAIMIVNRCALSNYYSLESCMILSAADEGVVRGLNENMNMQFKERITEGASECLACINEVKE